MSKMEGWQGGGIKATFGMIFSYSVGGRLAGFGHHGFDFLEV